MAKCQKGEPCVPCGEAYWNRYQDWRLAEGATIEDVNRELASIQAAVVSGLKAKRQSKPRPKGTGSVYQRAGTQYFWCQYVVNKKIIRESTHALTKTEATEYLNKKLLEVSSGKAMDPVAGKLLIGKLVDRMFAAKRNGTIPGARSVELDVIRWNANGKQFFGDMPVKELNKQTLTAYVEKRKEDGAANGTVNKEISILRAAFKYEEIETSIKWPRLHESNIRKDFLPEDKANALAAECAKVGLWLRAMFALAMSYGWRKSELMMLKTSQFDLAERTIRLEPGTTKNDQGRTVLLNAESYELVKACAAGKKREDYLFTDNDGKPLFRIECGRPVSTWRKTWRAVCKRAGVPDLRFHDLRRTSARNNRRLGVPENVIMKLSGWSTASMFKRYSIVSTDDQKDVVRLQDAKANAAKANSNYSSDTVKGEPTNSKTANLLN
jgi:integrase